MLIKTMTISTRELKWENAQPGGGTKDFKWKDTAMSRIPSAVKSILKPKIMLSPSVQYYCVKTLRLDRSLVNRANIDATEFEPGKHRNIRKIGRSLDWHHDGEPGMVQLSWIYVLYVTGSNVPCRGGAREYGGSIRYSTRQ